MLLAPRVVPIVALHFSLTGILLPLTTLTVALALASSITLALAVAILSGAPVDETKPAFLLEPPWRAAGLGAAEKFDEAVRSAPRMVGYLSGDEPLRMYSLYKQALSGDAPVDSSSGSSLRCRAKLAAWRLQKGRSSDECRTDYVALVDAVATRAASSMQRATAAATSAARRHRQTPDLRCRVRIIGVGRYLPERVVGNDEIERRGGFEPGTLVRSRSGVSTRHFAADGERSMAMAAKASLAALDDAGVRPEDLHAIINASGTPEQAIPDGGALLQRELGLGASGIRAFTVHATCLSFLVGLEMACALLHRADAPEDAAVLIASSEISSRNVDPTDEHCACLFGDGAAACVVRRPRRWEASCMHAARQETYAEGATCTELRGGGTSVDVADLYTNARRERSRRESYFSMDGPATLRLVLEHGPGFMERLQPGLSTSLGEIRWVVPHQASGLALDAIVDALGWPADRVLRTLPSMGNVIAASIPLTLHLGITSGKIKRGDRILLMGTGAGLSFGGIVLTY